MKTRILTLAMSTLVGGLLFLGTPKVQAQMIPEEVAKTTVINAIEYPEEAIEQHLEGVVIVSFIQKADGHLEVTGINSCVPELKDYVYETINSLKVPSYGGEDSEPIYLRFTFVLY